MIMFALWWKWLEALRQISVLVTSFVRLSVEVKLGRSDDEQGGAIGSAVAANPSGRFAEQI